MNVSSRAAALVLALVLAALAGSVPTTPAISATETKTAEKGSEFKPARQLFERYEALAAAFDTSLADLFSDSAHIENTRRNPDSTVKVLTLPAPAYKDLIRKVMPLAKARNDRNTYSKVTYEAEGPNVRIRGQRTSQLKKYTSPFSLLVGHDAEGRWLILEEITESQP
jgi:hypothetical protein